MLAVLDYCHSIFPGYVFIVSLLFVGVIFISNLYLCLFVSK